MARHLAGDLGNNVDIAGNPLHDYHCRRCCLPDAGLEAHPPRCPEANAVNLSFEAAEPAFEVADYVINRSAGKPNHFNMLNESMIIADNTALIVIEHG